MELNLLGIPVSVDWLTVILFVIFILDARLYIKKRVREASSQQYLLASVIVCFVTIGSVVLHEMGHGLAAATIGDPVVGAGISWWGAFVRPTIPLSNVSPISEIFVAAAGPVTNFIIAAMATYVVWVLPESLTENSIQYVAYVNIWLGRFNLLPILFLDGGKVLEGLLRLIGISGSTLSLVEGVAFGLVIFYYTALRKKGTKNVEDYLDTFDKAKAV